MSSPDAESDPTYTVFVKLPFPRGGFIDPPAVEWDAGKDKALWKILLKAPKNSDVDCKYLELFIRMTLLIDLGTALATKFEVTLPFLLQQVAWLYERQFSQVREQMRKATVSKGSLAPSPVPDSTSEAAGGEEMKRTGSGGGGSSQAAHETHQHRNSQPAGPRIQSSLSNRKSTPFSKNDGSVPNTPNRVMAPPFSRTSSRETTVQSRTFVAPSSRPTQATTNRRSLSPKQRSRPPSLAIDHPPRNSPQPAQLSSPRIPPMTMLTHFNQPCSTNAFLLSRKQTKIPHQMMNSLFFPPRKIHLPPFEESPQSFSANARPPQETIASRIADL
ncbi:hypothetical protein H4I96_06049 [Botrytis cinerea]